MKKLQLLSLATFLLLSVACDRSAAVEEAQASSEELAPVARPAATASTTTKKDGTKEEVEPQRLELQKVELAESPLKDLSQEERNTKLLTTTDDEVATQAIEFMESRVTLTDEQKAEIIAFSKELNLSDKDATDRRTALKTMRKKIKREILTADQLRQFKGNR